MSKVNRIYTSTGQLIIFKPTGPLPVVEPEWNKQSITPGIGVTQQGARVLKLKNTMDRLWKKHRAGIQAPQSAEADHAIQDDNK